MGRRIEPSRIGSIDLFCLVAEHGGFSAAARAAGLTTAALSHSVARLEANLGVRLFHRTTRTVRLTDAGERYHDRCKRVLAELVDAEREIADHQTKPRGTVRLSVPTSYGHHRVLPLLPAFRAIHPDVHVDVHVSNRNVDFAHEGFDLAVRARVPKDAGLVARKLEDAKLLLVASPSYLRERAAPVDADGLRHHDCIPFVLPSTGQVVPWLLSRAGATVEWTPPPGLRCSGDILAPLTLARAGGGIAQTYRFLAEPDLARGTLVEVLPGSTDASRPFSLVYPSGPHLPPRVRLLIDFLVGELGGRTRSDRRAKPPR